MKSRRLSLLLLPAASFAANAPVPALPEFSQAVIALPPLSLADGARQALPLALRRVRAPRRQDALPFAAAPAAPGLAVPTRDVDPKMIARPNPSIEVRMLVAEPPRDIDAE